MSKLSRITSS